MLKKLTILAVAAGFAAAPLPILAQGKKDSVVMAMALEPPGLDPTTAAAAAIAEVTLYNVYETLTKINEDGSVSPLLAESWQTSPDLKTYTFKLRKGVKFQNGEPFDSAAVKFSFDRNAAPNSTNKDKGLAHVSGDRADVCASSTGDFKLETGPGIAHQIDSVDTHKTGCKLGRPAGSG